MSNRDFLESSPNIFTPIMPSCRRQYRQCLSISANLIPNEHSAISSVVLEEDFCLRKDAYLAFLPKINDSTTREAIGHFQINIEKAIKYIDHVYYCCSWCVDFLKLESIPDNDAILMAAFETYIHYRYDLDVCSCCSRSFNFCHNCWNCISRSREPKFGISNKMPKLYCQY